MKIASKPTNQFQDLTPGTVFSFDGILYMKTDTNDKYYIDSNAVELANGTRECIDDLMDVTVVNCELLLK